MYTVKSNKRPDLKKHPGREDISVKFMVLSTVSNSLVWSRPGLEDFTEKRAEKNMKFSFIQRFIKCSSNFLTPFSMSNFKSNLRTYLISLGHCGPNEIIWSVVHK